MARPNDWDILDLNNDPTPGVVESVQALADQFHAFADDVESAWRSLNAFGGDAAALSWVGQSAQAFDANYGPLPGRLQKLYTSYREAGDALDTYWPKLQAAQAKADRALADGRIAHDDVQRLTGQATTAAADLKTAKAGADPDKLQTAQTAHDHAQTNLSNAKARLAADKHTAESAGDDRIAAARECQKALHGASHDGIHNKSWWDHVGEDLAEFGGKLAEYAGDVAMIASALAPVLNLIAAVTAFVPGLDVITAGLAAADDLIATVADVLATVGTVVEMTGDAMQGKWGGALLDAGMLGLQLVGGRMLGKLGDGAETDAKALAHDGEGNAGKTCLTDPIDVVSGQMLTDETDLALPGVLPLVLRRAYASGFRDGGLFGPGWSATLDQRLAVNAAGIHFVGDDAQTLHYPDPREASRTSGISEAGQTVGGVLPVAGPRWPLVWDRATDEIRITDPKTGRTRHFPAARLTDERGQLRDLAALSDRNGNRIDFVRDGNGVPTGVEHSGGYRVAIDSEATVAGPRIAAIRVLDGDNEAEAGGTTIRRFAYDGRGRLEAVVNTSGLPYRYEHDEADRVTAWTDRVGYRYTYEYDAAGRVVRTRGDQGFMSGSFVYDETNRTTAFTDSRGATSVYRYDDRGHIEAVTDPFGHVTVLRHDEFGRILARTDALGHTTAYRRDERGDVVGIRNPDGTAVEIAYNDLGLVTAVTAADGAVWRREYDERGNLRTLTDPLGATTAYRHHANGARSVRTDALGQSVRIDCDAAGLPVAIVDPLGGTTRARRDAFGRIVAVTDAVGARTTCGWTPEGQPAWQVGADGARRQWRYDAEGRLVAHTDALGRTTLFEPGPFGKVVGRTDPDGSRYRFDYDTELNLVAVTNAAEARWQYAYDAAGRLTSETDFIGRTLDFGHDAAGRLVARTNGLGQRTFLDRDWAGRLTRRRTADDDVRYEYDRAGRLVAAAGRAASVAIERRADGRVRSETVDGRTISYEYDAVGRQVRRTTPTGLVSAWSFDAAGRAEELATGTGRLAFGHDAAGRETERALGPQTWLLREVDAMGRTAAQQVWTGDRPATSAQDSRMTGPGGQAGRLLLGRRYAYRPDGMPSEITEITEISGVAGMTGVAGIAGIAEAAGAASTTRRFDSDELGRVTSVDGATWTESYAYDAFGNVARSSTPAGGDTAGDRETDRTLIRRAGRTSFEHDRAGRLVRSTRRTLSGGRKVWEYTWDAEDRLARVTLPDGTAWHYAYDPMGRRSGKARIAADGSVAEQVRFVWDGTRLAEQHAYAADGTVTALTWDYDPGTFRPAAQTRRSWSSWAKDADQRRVDEAFHAIVTDLVGAPTELVSPDGRVAWRTAASLWGRTISVAADPGVECPLRFPGQYHDDETGLHYNLHRYYDPDTGAYLTPDPLGLTPAPNDHAYVPNPLVWVDPLGLMCATHDPEMGGLDEDTYQALRGSHGDQVADGVDYQVGRMHDGTASAADHEIPGIGHDPAALADYFKSWQGNMTHYDVVQGSHVAFDEQKNVIIVETADKIHGYKYTPDQFNNAKTKNGNPRYIIQ